MIFFVLILQMLIDFRWIAGKFVSPACTPSYVSTLILLEL